MLIMIITMINIDVYMYNIGDYNNHNLAIESLRLGADVVLEAIL